jgi:small subunit ribosomal protein S17
MVSAERGNRKIFKGIVVRDKMDKTVMVQVERMVQDPQYKKYVRRRKQFMAHDEKNECHTGDLVEITETRPVSKNKRFKVLRVLKRGQVLAEEAVGNDTK